MNATETPAVEDLTTTSWHPMFDEETREYLRRVRLADPAALAPYRTDTCCECDEIIPGDGFVPGEEVAHVVQDGSVVLGCEGYWLVSPAALGLRLGLWDDWRAFDTVDGIALLTAEGVALDPGAIAAAAICVYQRVSPPTRPLTFREPAIPDEGTSEITWVTYDLPLAAWAADLGEGKAAALAPEPGWYPPENCICYEALCRRCGGIFNPDLRFPGGSGLEHYQRHDQRTGCGGRGDLLGGWK